MAAMESHVAARYNGSVSCIRGKVPQSPPRLCTTSWWNSSSPPVRIDACGRVAPEPLRELDDPLEEEVEEGEGSSGMKAATSRASMTSRAPKTKGGPGTNCKRKHTF